MVIATQNPIEYEGTYPLPEAQLDRFTMRLALGYPPLADEARMLDEQTTEPPLDSLGAGRRRSRRSSAAIEEARALFVEESLNRYVVALLRHTRGELAALPRREPARRDRAAPGREGARARRGPRLRRSRTTSRRSRGRCSRTG